MRESRNSASWPETESHCSLLWCPNRIFQNSCRGQRLQLEDVVMEETGDMLYSIVSLVSSYTLRTQNFVKNMDLMISVLITHTHTHTHTKAHEDTGNFWR